ncbi:MAG: hypothetical protein ACYDEI_02935 [Erysipelotrichaceae bacterium]
MKKASILFFFLIIFVYFLELFEINIKILNQKYFELNNYDYISTFSYIESDILIKTINNFYQYKLEDFVEKTELGSVNVNFIDEVAYIKFDFEKPVFARLNYDLVYNSCINYELIIEALFPVVDKLNS